MTINTNIPAPLARALAAKGYDTLTEVQESVLTLETPESDLLVSAQTGSGKTVAFGMAIAPTILGEEETFGFAAEPVALIIAPTRELALQVKRELEWLYADAKARIASCVGGMDPRQERRMLERGCHIVVGTPGRLRDHIERGALDMSGLKAVVLDEADEMLDFGFKEDLEFILDQAPASRRTLLFSATVPPAIAKLAKDYQRDALRIATIGEQEQHGDIDYRALLAAPKQRDHAIINTLRFYDADRAIVFCSTREAVSRLTSKLGNRGFSTVALSGELTQNERSHALQAMRDGRARVCVATDVAARGIDLPGLELVIHADLPGKAETLLHRSGRTGRAGQKGICALIVPGNRKGRANRLLNEAKVEATWENPPSLDAIVTKDRERIFNDAALLASYDGEALEDAKALLAIYGPEQIAAAFLQRANRDLPAPEDIIEETVKKPNAPRAVRENFEDGVWFSLSAGRKHRAEPRWLLPLICRVGDITKREVGNIQIGTSESRVEIAGSVAEAFQTNVAAAGGGEKNIRITLLAADAPPLDRSPFNQDRGDRPAPHRGKGPREDRAPRKRDDWDDNKKSWDDKPWDKKQGEKKSWNKKDGDKKGGYKKDGGKPYGAKKTGEKAFGDRDFAERKFKRDDERKDRNPFKDRAETAEDARSDDGFEPRRKPGKPGGKPGGKFGGKFSGKAGDKPKRPYRPGGSKAPGAEDRPQRRKPTESRGGKPGFKPGDKGASLKRKPRRDS